MPDIYGRNAVREALASEADINHIKVVKGAHHAIIDEIYSLAKQRRIPITAVDRKVLDNRFVGENHQGVYASVAEMAYVEWEEMVEKAQARGQAPLLVICDDIEDPHNLGAIIRNADAFGAHGVIIGKRRSASLTEGAVKAAAGAAQHMPVARVGNISQTIKALKQQGIWVCGTAADGVSMYDQDLSGPLAVVIGSEATGMGRLVRDQCDYVVSIPSGGHVGSLNASVACGIVLCQVAHGRR